MNESTISMEIFFISFHWKRDRFVPRKFLKEILRLFKSKKFIRIKTKGFAFENFVFDKIELIVVFLLSNRSTFLYRNDGELRYLSQVRIDLNFISFDQLFLFSFPPMRIDLTFVISILETIKFAWDFSCQSNRFLCFFSTLIIFCY